MRGSAGVAKRRIRLRKPVDWFPRVRRLHGRNHATWNKKGLASSADRFNYDYNDSELAEARQANRVRRGIKRPCRLQQQLRRPRPEERAQSDDAVGDA